MPGLTVYQLVEPTIIAIRTLLQSQLNGYIDQINAGITDPATVNYKLPYPGQIFDSPPSLEQQTAFPVLWVQDLPSEFQDDLAFSVTGHHDLLVVAAATNADLQGLAWQLRRYQQAIASCVLANRNLGGNAGWATGLKQTAPGPTLERQNPQEWISWSGVRLWIKREEA